MAVNVSGGGHSGLYFIVGAMFVVVCVFGFLYFGGHLGGGESKKINVTIEAPKK